MVSPAEKISNESFSFSSCTKSDVWHPEKDAKGYEWWYFDALSDDGNEAVVVFFLDNFVFSPAYNSLTDDNLDKKIPAVVFIYYKDGKPAYRAINEFAPEDFEANTETPECSIANNNFRLKSAPYGSGYVLEINVKLKKDQHLTANFEWLSIETDLNPATDNQAQANHFWNLVSSRSDVTGRISVTNQNGTKDDEVNFRGTGYHDHNRDNRWMPETIREWQRGHCHFPDTTAVFFRYEEMNSSRPETKLFLTRDYQISEKRVSFEVSETSRDILGLKYPKRIKMNSDDGVEVEINQGKPIDSTFFYLRFLSEITLKLADRKPRKTIGITEHLDPKTLKYRWLDWLVKMRIGKNGKSPLLP